MATRKKQKILVVDDEIKACQLLSRFLTKRGFSVQIASNGRDALIKAVEFKPNCILLDVRMPQGGSELLSSLKLKLPESIVFMMSAFIEVDQHQDYLGRGAHACINKPVDLVLLLNKIRQALK